MLDGCWVRLRDGEIVRLGLYPGRAEALAAAGLEEAVEKGP